MRSYPYTAPERREGLLRTLTRSAHIHLVANGWTVDK